MTRHNGKNVVMFVDGHAETLQSSKWYWMVSPWLKPDTGG